MIATMFFVLVRVSLTHYVNFYILNIVQYTFVNDHNFELSCIVWKMDHYTYVIIE